MRLAVIMVVVLYLFTSFSFAQECDYAVEILAEGAEFTKESFKWRMKAVKLEGKSANITGTARIEDLNGNLVKSYKPWTNHSISKQKTSNEYSPNLNEGSYKIISEIIVDCDDINQGNNVDVKAIKITQGNMEMQETNIAVQQLVLENLNKLTNNPEINESQNNESLPENKSKEYENTANLKAENAQENSISAEHVKNPDKKYAYVSSNEKAKNLIVYFLLAISIALNIALIWRR